MNDLPTWDHLLHHYVDRAGRVDYEAWTAHHPQTLARWLAQQSADTQGHQDHLAHWINLYNAFTIQAVLSAFPITSIRNPRSRFTAFRKPRWRSWFTTARCAPVSVAGDQEKWKVFQDSETGSTP
jgi:hypothetical protein